MGQRADGSALLFGDPLIGEVPPDPLGSRAAVPTEAAGMRRPGVIASVAGVTRIVAGLRDPEMHQTRKDNQWHFGMKAHIGVDSRSKVIHAVVATAANVADATVLPDLLHGDETRVGGDQAYRGQRVVIREHAPNAQDFINRRYQHHGVVNEAEKMRSRTKSKVRAKVEHCFGVIRATYRSHRNVTAARVAEVKHGEIGRSRRRLSAPSVTN